MKKEKSLKKNFLNNKIKLFSSPLKKKKKNSLCLKKNKNLYFRLLKMKKYIFYSEKIKNNYLEIIVNKKKHNYLKKRKQLFKNKAQFYKEKREFFKKRKQIKKSGLSIKILKNSKKQKEKQKLFLNKRYIYKEKKSINKYIVKKSLRKRVRRPYNYFKFIKAKKNKRKKRKAQSRFLRYGFLRVATERKNIFCTLSSLRGKILRNVSIGLLKVKSRKKRQAPYLIKGTGILILNKIFKLNKELKKKVTRLILIHKGRSFKKKKKILLKVFAQSKIIKFIKINRSAPRSHNGCRPRKKKRR